jgi:preprotein translocase subunit SecE
MGLSIYKSGQGYWTRTLTAVGAGTIILSGVMYLWGQLSVIKEHTQYYQGGMAIGVILFFAIILYWVLNKPRIADFMIATEAEMKKVNWPARREIVGSTWIVIAGTFMFAVLLFLTNIFFGWLFQYIGVLEGAT